ncbi:MAG: hypothetical protein ABIV06_13185 [Thermoanaerobaculia bacterium]
MIAPHRSGNPIPPLFLLIPLVLAIALQLGLARLEGPFGERHPRPLSGDEKRYIEVATAWAAGEPVELDPLWPPGYPVAVALVLRCGGSLSWVVGIQVLALLAAGVALARVAQEAGASPAASALAGALLILDPEVAIFARLFRPEALHLALLLVALLLAIRASGPGEDRSRPRRLALLGVALGLAITLKSLLLPFVPLFVLGVMLSRTPPESAGPRWRGSLARGLFVVVPLLAVLTPVLLIQHAESGSWSLGGSARFNLWVGLTDRSSRSLSEDRTWEEYQRYRAAGATFAERQAAITVRLRELVATRGLPATVAGQWPRQYFRLFDRESYFSAMLPPRGNRFLDGEGYRAAPPSLARLLGGAEAVFYIALLGLAPFGLVRLMRARRPGALWFAVLLGCQLALFYFVHVKARYRLTILPLLVLGAVWAIESFRRSRRDESSAIPALDFGLGLAGAAVLLFFGFAAP